LSQNNTTQNYRKGCKLVSSSAGHHEAPPGVDLLKNFLQRKG
jgi:hypothetical protein